MCSLVAGCAAEQPPTAGDPSEKSEVPVGEAGTEHPNQEPPPHPGSTTPAAPVALVASTWYPHVVETCGKDDPLCNCGTNRLFISTVDIPMECDGHGRRSALPYPFPETCPPLCFPNDEQMPAYPAGAPVDGVIYVTSDAADVMTLHVELLADNERVGGADVGPVQVVGAGGFTWQAVEFSFELEKPVPTGAPTELRVHFDAVESWFLGYDGDHTSKFTITPPQ